jgi:hypothetical protein
LISMRNTIFSQVFGRNNVVCVKNLASTIVSMRIKKSDINEESEYIVVAAAKRIHTQICTTKYSSPSMEKYPRNTKHWTLEILVL